MKTMDGPSKIKLLSLIMLSILIGICFYGYHINDTYRTISVVMKDNAKIEYGDANYNISDLVKKVDGKIVSIKNDIDTNVVGEQEVVVEVKKENIVRSVPILITVVDTTEHYIQLKE